jgi:ABC-type sugar transport system permease subunit
LASAIAMVLLVITLAFSIMNIRLLERGTEVEA